MSEDMKIYARGVCGGVLCGAMFGWLALVGVIGWFSVLVLLSGRRKP